MKKCKMNLEFIIPDDVNINSIIHHIQEYASSFGLKGLKINSTTKEIEDEGAIN